MFFYTKKNPDQGMGTVGGEGHESDTTESWELLMTWLKMCVFFPNQRCENLQMFEVFFGVKKQIDVQKVEWLLKKDYRWL